MRTSRLSACGIANPNCEGLDWLEPSNAIIIHHQQGCANAFEFSRGGKVRIGQFPKSNPKIVIKSNKNKMREN